MYTARDKFENYEDYLAAEFDVAPQLIVPTEDRFNDGVKTLDALGDDLSLNIQVLEFS